MFNQCIIDGIVYNGKTYKLINDSVAITVKQLVKNGTIKEPNKIRYTYKHLKLCNTSKN